MTVSVAHIIILITASYDNMMISEWWIVDGVEGRELLLSRDVRRGAEEYHGDPVMLAGLWVGIWTINVTITKQGCQHWPQTLV